MHGQGSDVEAYSAKLVIAYGKVSESNRRQPYNFKVKTPKLIVGVECVDHDRIIVHHTGPL